MTAQAWQHLVAIIATVLAAIASGLQAWRALEKADHERFIPVVRDGGEPRLKDRNRAHFSDLWKKNDPMNPEFDVKHFHHVAILWSLIVLSSLIAVLAEIIDWAIDKK
jgi:hypothetical protein